VSGEIRAAPPGPGESCPPGAAPLPLRCPCGGARFYTRALGADPGAGVWLRCARCGADYSGISVGVADSVAEFGVEGTVSCGFEGAGGES
jgi:hypothetical protein